MREPTLLRPGSIKICGLREAEHAVAAAEAGANLISFIFAPTRRYVAPEDARLAIEAARAAAGASVKAVGVFVNASVAEMNSVAQVAGLDVIQLSGDEEPGDMTEVCRPVLRALRPPPGTELGDLLGVVDRWQSILPSVTFLIDAYHPGHFGGSGARADWRLAAGLAARQSIMLAGGLDSGNVGEAIAAVKPAGVDVSSGVEIDGRKDTATIRDFVRLARAAFIGQGLDR